MAIRSKRARIHAGEAMTYTGYGELLNSAGRRSQIDVEGYRHGCSCHRAGVYTVPDYNDECKVRLTKGWIWGKEFSKIIYYI